MKINDEKQQRILVKIKDAAAKILEEEGVEAEFVSGAIISPDGSVSFGMASDDEDDEGDDEGDDTETFGESFVTDKGHAFVDAEVRAIAAEHGRAEAFDEVTELFTSIEEAHAHTTNGQDALAAIDKLAEGQPLRALFNTATDKTTANRAVQELMETADLRLLMEFLYELGKAVDLLPKLQALLGRRLALRVTSHVVGKTITESTLKTVEARLARKGTKGDSKAAELSEAMAALRESIATAKKRRTEKKPCDCAGCTARREHERKHLN